MDKPIEFEPIGKRVVVLRHVPESGMLLTPEIERESYPDIGVVIKVGQIGWWNKYIRGIRPGRKIAFVKFSPINVRDGDKENIFVDLGNILGIQK